MFPPQRLLQPGQPGSRLLRHHLLRPLPPAHLLLRLARPHHQGHEDLGGECHISASVSTNLLDPIITKRTCYVNFMVIVLLKIQMEVSYDYRRLKDGPYM